MRTVPSIGPLRLFRLVRLARTMRIVKGETSLFDHVRFISSLLAIGWNSRLLSFVLLVWAIIAVQTPNPIVLRKVAAGDSVECPRCVIAYSSTLQF